MFTASTTQSPHATGGTPERPGGRFSHPSLVRSGSRSKWSSIVLNGYDLRRIQILAGGLVPTREFLEDLFSQHPSMGSSVNPSTLKSHAASIGEVIFMFAIKTQDNLTWT